MAYSASTALSFAHKYWNLVCPDGFIGMAHSSPQYQAVDKGGKFEIKTDPGDGDALDQLRLPNGTLIDGKAIDDCAHFISCCIGHPPGASAGGTSLKSAFPTAGIYGQISAQALFVALTAAGGAGQVIGSAKMNRATANTAIASLRAGDLIFYFDPGNGQYHHAGLWLADPKQRIACHSYIRCDVDDSPDQEWFSVGITDVSYTFVRIS